MRANLLYEFKRAIDGAECIGGNKKGYNNEHHKRKKIFSYDTYENYIEFSSTLVHYLKKFYPNVKHLKNIKEYHIENFLRYKVEQGVSKNTIENYKSRIRMLDVYIAQEYHFKIHMERGIKDDIVGLTDKVRNIAMDREDLEAILKLRRNSKSKAYIGLVINSQFGLRVQEVVKLKGKDFDLDKMVVHIINSKGKKSRDVLIDTMERLAIAKYVKENFKDNERIVPLREDTVNEFIQNALEELGITKYRDAKTSTHSIRKLVATENIERYMDEGMTKEEALKKESLQLGHNRTNVVINSYYLPYEK